MKTALWGENNVVIAKTTFWGENNVVIVKTTFWGENTYVIVKTAFWGEKAVTCDFNFDIKLSCKNKTEASCQAVKTGFCTWKL